ncbi:MAG TPA: S9 family peptidase [Bryobacteraceae bacterium]|jgi:dipeptidyl aminopeptidase/acylaminoacyl peptidase|nr:S9 family peptidase [Bryobacteraceae bacterium]
MKAISVRLVPILLAVVACAQTPAGPTGWTPEISMQVQPVGDVTPSPDGKLVAYTQSHAVIETEKSEVDTQIFLAAADGSHRAQLTRGEKSASAPEFSPDGRYVYFSSERNGKPNLFRIPVDGGEAEMLTDWKGEIGAFHVSPDGKWIAFAGMEARPDEEQAKKEKRDFRVVDENPRNHSLWVIAAEADSQEKRTPRRLTNTPDYHVQEFDWSPDSAVIAFAHTPTPGADDWPKSDISEVTVQSGAVRPVAATAASEHSPRYSPDGRYLAYVRSTDPARWAGIDRIVLRTRQSGEARELPPTFDEAPALLGWAGDSARLLFTEARGTVHVVYAMPTDGPPTLVYEPRQGTLQPGRLNATGTVFGFAGESWDEAPEAYVVKVGDSIPQRVSSANLDLPKLPLGETKRVAWKAADGLEIEGLLTYPVGYESVKKYPLVLVIHGGPTGVFQDSFLGRYGLYPYATFAARGYAVLRANPRGSGGYGRTFRFANMNDWGGKDYLDLMAGVDHVISMGVADPERLAVMGWSYGGFMTSWVVTHTHRFKAAVVGAGVTDLWSFTGTSDIPGFLPDYFSGEPSSSFDGYYNHSPLAFVKGVTTPTLILHGEADVRVPTTQGYEFYSALKRQGVTTKMVVYPRTPHGPREPKFLLDIMQRHVDWVKSYLGN